MGKEIDISYSPYSYFLKPKKEEISVGFLLSVLVHALLVAAVIYFPESQKSQQTKPVKKGMGSLPVVVWNGDPRTGAPYQPKKDLFFSTKPKASPTSMIVPTDNFTENSLEGLREAQFKIPKSRLRPLGDGEKNDSPGSGYVVYPAGSPNGVDSDQARDFDANDKDTGSSVAEILNDEEFVYTSFFSRLKDNLYPIWVRKVRTNVTDADFRFSPTARTRLLVRTDEQGVIQKVEQMESSGCGSCDDIAQESLLSLGRVTHPPNSFRQPDGLYDFKLTFTIYTQYSRSFIEVEPVEVPSRWPRAR